MNIIQNTKLADIYLAHAISNRNDLSDRVRFEHPSGNRWASLRFPSIGKPQYVVYCHAEGNELGNSGFFDNSMFSRKCNSFADALDLIHSFLFVNLHADACPAEGRTVPSLV